MKDYCAYQINESLSFTCNLNKRISGGYISWNVVIKNNCKIATPHLRNAGSHGKYTYE